ncbi:MAG: hypothetical protein GXO00_01935 [Candidatus Diapherotrites archaeon]|nr:hypothetical protein [Candidatus Diapherotrites archaeon]
MVISALLKDNSFSRFVIALIKRIFDVFYPTFLYEEIEKHVPYILAKRRNGVSRGKLRLMLRLLFNGIHKTSIRPREEDFTFVKDPADVFYVATARHLRKYYKKVYLLTWNKKDFKEEKLEKENIFVLTPSELFARLSNL